ncbi:MAG: M56 family metallopeptidase [Candidatus Scatovivens sp.]
MEICLYLLKNILTPLFCKIAMLSISATIVGIMLLIVEKILKNKISCKINQLIWIVFFISLIIMPKIENSLSVYNFINIEKVNQFSINITFNSLDTYNNLNSNEDYEFKDFKQNVTNQIDTLEIKDIISIIYFSAIIFKILKNIVIRIFWFKSKKEILSKDDEEYKILEKIKSKLNIKKEIILIKSNYINSPKIGGLINPKIYLSNKNLNVKDLECILTHELCHYKRKDIITNILTNIFKIFHFFNPIVIVCLNRIEKNIEILTDEMALKVLNETYKKRYCTLLVLMSFYKKGKMEEGLKLGFARSFIEERVDKIIVNQKFIENKKYIIVLIFILISIMFFCFTKEKIDINDEELKFLTININNTEYKIENYDISKEYKYIKCKVKDTIKIYGNENLFSLTLNVIDLENKKENNSTFFFKNNDIKIFVGEKPGKFAYEMKIKYETEKEIKYYFIIEIE